MRQYRLQIAASRPPSKVEPWAVTRMREFLPIIRATSKSSNIKNAWYALLHCFSPDLIFIITGSVSHVRSHLFLIRFALGRFPW